VSNYIGDSNKMVSDTPRLVDQILLSEKNDWTADLYRVGCDLQRELNAANDRIKRLEEAGDALYEGWIGYGFTKDKHLAAWRKAKDSQ
jgi:hypothetical protein